MPRFQKLCNNPLHEKWNGQDDICDELISFRAAGLVELASVIVNLEENENKRPKHIMQTSTNYLENYQEKLITAVSGITNNNFVSARRLFFIYI